MKQMQQTQDEVVWEMLRLALCSYSASEPMHLTQISREREKERYIYIYMRRETDKERETDEQTEPEPETERQKDRESACDERSRKSPTRTQFVVKVQTNCRISDH